MAKNKEVPGGVKVISVLYYIGAVIAVIGAIMAIAGGTLVSGFVGLDGLGLGMFLAVIMLAFAVLGFFIGRGLWKAQNWARVVAIIFAILGALGAISAIVAGGYTSIISLAINGLIGGYLLLSEDVKKAFA